MRRYGQAELQMTPSDFKRARNLRDVGIWVKPKDLGVVEGGQRLDVLEVLVQGLAEGDFISGVKAKRRLKHLLAKPDLHGREKRRNKVDKHLNENCYWERERAALFPF